MKNELISFGEIIKCKEDEVKPCPFCGSKEIVIEKCKYTFGDRFSIFCVGCLATIDPGWVQNKHTVINMWNKRVQVS